MTKGAAQSSGRVPLGDASRRVNYSAPTMLLKPHKAASSEDTLPPTQLLNAPSPATGRRHRQRAPTSRERTQFESKRNSQLSQDSAASTRNKEGYKRFIGPWQLGKTLGKGSSARVRLCRHRYTHQSAAVKIVSKRMAYMIPDTSLAALNKWDSGMPEQINGELRVPMAIEREVAILKLIDHPNIMKLYDIWENRSEIYLILEYVDGGDLFSFIVENSPLSEETVMGLFRQILSAIAYCHSFNICHRDLKPENILITKTGQIKIADFGMAALHQTENHRLATFCGSPHYAAPELLSQKHYRGDKADIWSLGVILYAMLISSLPFDDPNFDVMVEKTKKGTFSIPDFVSFEGRDMIQRMIRVNPNRRISLREMWNHALVRKYNHLDQLGINLGQPPGGRQEFQHIPVTPAQLDGQLLRQLRSMYHIFTNEQLKAFLLSDESNDQKVFYWLLYNYREKQLEDFSPELSHSMSDYHHLKPSAWKKRVSTCAFSQPRAKGNGRSVSRFTVISNVAESEAETVQSYDPFKASRSLHARNSQSSRAKVVVHSHVLDPTSEEGPTTDSQILRRETAANYHRKAGSQRASSSLRKQSSRASMNSLHSSRQGTLYGRAVPTRKRGVDFSHIRRQSVDRQHKRTLDRQLSGGLVSITSDSTRLKGSKGLSPKRRQREEARLHSVTVNVLKPKDPHQSIREDVQLFSSDIAKDCDDAFNSSLIDDVSFCQSVSDADVATREQTPMSFNLASTESPGTLDTAKKPWDSRPLPPLPHEPGAKRHSLAAGQELGQAKASLGLRLSLPTRRPNRRVVSAPLPPHDAGAKDSDLFATGREIPDYMAQRELERPRNVSAPARQEDPLSVNGQTIRIVNSPLTQNPVNIPKPLNILKKNKADMAANPTSSLRKLPSSDSMASRIARDLIPGTRKLASWFRKPSKSDVSGGVSEQPKASKRDSQCFDSGGREPDSFSTTQSISTRKKAFGFLFWKNKGISTMSIQPDANGGPPSPDLAQDDAGKIRFPRLSTQDTGSETRNIDVKQNWLARLFRVKPAMSYLCFNISRKRTRQEIAILLREWRKYGMRDVQVDKERNIIFARVGSDNYLELKEVAFAVEMMSVVEHGRRSLLSIVRLTQERGAASSFHKVVDTMRLVFDGRNLLVKDRRKAKMMIKTLNS